MYTDEHGCVPVELYLGTLTFEFDVILACHAKFLFECFPSL